MKLVILICGRESRILRDMDVKLNLPSLGVFNSGEAARTAHL